MPELPEVQCFCDDLNKKYSGKIVGVLRFRRAGIREPFQKKELRSVLASGVRLVRFFRIGKRLILETERGRVAISLGMTGHFVDSISGKPALHEHISIEFSDDTGLGFVDARRFGSWRVIPSDFVDAAVDGTNEEGLLALLLKLRTGRTKRPIKSFLMDQSLIGGVGNIYAVEALFRAGIRPDRSCDSLRKQDCRLLAKALPEIFSEAIRLGGSSIVSYKRLSGDSGGFQNSHQVYGRDGLSCVRPRCSGIICKMTQAGRSSWYCPVCQK